MIRSKKLTKASARSPQFYRHTQEFFNILVFYPIGNALWLSVNFGGSVVILQSAQVEFRAIIRNKPKSPDLRSTSTSLTIASRPPTDSSSRPSKLLEVQLPIQEIANSASERMKECLLYFRAKTAHSDLTAPRSTSSFVKLPCSRRTPTRLVSMLTACRTGTRDTNICDTWKAIRPCGASFLKYRIMASLVIR